MKKQPPSGPPSQLRPEDIDAQLVVLKTKTNQISVQFPAQKGSIPGGAPPELDFPTTLELFAAGLQTLAAVVRGQQPVEKSRIMVAPAIPKDFLLKGKL